MQTLTRFSLLASLIAASALPAAAVTTIFAPGVTKESGWYDTNKAFTNQDSQLCWAATATNIVAWWLDTYQRKGGDLSGVERNTAQIFQTFQNNWENVGYSNMDGVGWYFTGKFSSGREPDELEVSNSGGYLAHLDGIGRVPWGLINGDFKYRGNEETGEIFLNDMSGSYYENDPLYSLKSFSETIIAQLSRGASMLSVHKVSGISISGHSITLWGCDYDEALGLVTKIYVTDSDDRHVGLREYKIGLPPSGNGVLMEDYWYDSSLYGRITSSTMMYSAYIPEPSAFGLLAGVLAFGLGVSRRRR